MKKFFLCTVGVAFALASVAQRFAYVDVQYILENIPAYQTAQEQLNNTAELWHNEISQKMQEVDMAYKAFQAEQVLMTEQMKAEKIKEIEDLERAVKELQKEKFGANGALFEKRQELIKPIQDDIYNAIQEMAKEKSYDFIFDKSGGVTMLFANDRYDKSNDILQRMGH